jgi:hypothetical protein
MSTGTSLSAWEQRGAELAAAHRRTCWDIGDWLLAGEPHVGIKGVLNTGERLFGKKRTTLETYASCARAFPAESSTRVEDLTFAHHRVVMGLPQAERTSLLAQAVAEKLTVKELVERASPPDEPAAPPAPPEPPQEQFVLDGFGWYEHDVLQRMAAKARLTVPALVRLLLAPIIEADQKSFLAEKAERVRLHKEGQTAKKEADLPKRMQELRGELIHARSWKERLEVRLERIRRIAPDANPVELRELFIWTYGADKLPLEDEEQYHQVVGVLKAEQRAIVQDYEPLYKNRNVYFIDGVVHARKYSMDTCLWECAPAPSEWESLSDEPMFALAKSKAPRTPKLRAMSNDELQAVPVTAAAAV